MEFTRWINQSLPQTLLIGTYLLYFEAVLGLLTGRVGMLPLSSGLGLVLLIGSVAAGLGISNDYRWGWYVGLAVSAVPVAVLALVTIGFLDSLGLRSGLGLIVAAIFPVAQLALLAHPMSVQHQKIWFR